MRLNIFSILPGEIDSLRRKLHERRMEVIREVDQGGWHGDFFFSTRPSRSEIPWVKDFAAYFDPSLKPANLTYYATFLFTRDDEGFALSYGKSHFYIRPFCDYDFGIEVAKRIADEFDIKQTASRRFQGRRRKDIRSYTSGTRLDVESGESVDYIQARVIETHVDGFGSAGKFGASALLSPPAVDSGTLGSFLTSLRDVVAEEPRFSLPRTVKLTEPSEVSRFDEVLIDELAAPVGTTEFTHNSYDLYGIDFVFSTDGMFRLRCPGYGTRDLAALDIKDLKTYILEENIARGDILKISISHRQEDRPRYTQTIKEALDFIADDDLVLLSGGRWMRFNQDYLSHLDDYLASIKVEPTEAEFQSISLTEPDFNVCEEVKDAGYNVADKDFSIFQTRASTPIEAWDLRKGGCVYAVKFGTPQKLGYVCDQAGNLLELLRNRAGVSEIQNFQQYCLWLGYRSKKGLDDIRNTGSIIFKQKIETWARKAREMGVEPVLKFSRKVVPGIDDRLTGV